MYFAYMCTSHICLMPVRVNREIFKLFIFLKKKKQQKKHERKGNDRAESER